MINIVLTVQVGNIFPFLLHPWRLSSRASLGKRGSSKAITRSSTSATYQRKTISDVQIMFTVGKGLLFILRMPQRFSFSVDKVAVFSII